MSLTLPNTPITGDGIRAKAAAWEFNKEVAIAFDSHVSKSVPYYQETHQVVVEMSDWFVSDGSVVYDLGCSTGTLISDLVRRHAAINRDVRFIGLDKSEPMLEQAQKNLEGYRNVELLRGDALTHQFANGVSMVYSLYTLQFVDPLHRQALIQRIYNCLAPRGAFVLVEKVLDHDPVVEDIFIHLHWSKKAQMGFDVTEIYAKAQSLRGVLVPYTVEENKHLLENAGFRRISTFFQWCNFIGFLAIK